jgi:chemotaxis protein methyltransferase CheR
MKADGLLHAMTERVDLSPFKQLLLRSCGHSFEKEREQALSASICRRMAVHGIDMFNAYYSLLLRDQVELLCLTELLTVNETYFFREPEHLNLMVDRLLPEIMGARKERPIRILSAGCSTGEEPYSVAMMLQDKFGDECKRLFAITGVDIDSAVVSSAKKGVYGKGSFRGMKKSLLERYFEPVGVDRFQINDLIRKRVEFEVVNLLAGNYPEVMQMPDIILYRNVSIYFPRPVQEEIFTRLSELLADLGCLLVGASETIHHDLGILSLVREDSLFFYRKTPPLIFEERRRSSRSYIPPGRVRNVSPQTVSITAVKPVATHSRNQEIPAKDGTPKQFSKYRQVDIREHFDAAIQHAHNKEHDKALKVLDSIIEQDDTFEKAKCLKGSLLLSISKFDEAHDICNNVLSRDSLCLEAYLMLGIIERQRGNIDIAIKRFREAIYLDSSCWLAHFYTAEICYAQRDEKRAISGYEVAVRILEKVPVKEHGQAFFPLSVNAEQFMFICRHKLSLLKKNG